MSQCEAALTLLSPAILDYVVNGNVQTRSGNRSRWAAPHGAYPCKGNDRWCALAIFTGKEWQTFLKTIGNPEWGRDPRFTTLEARQQNEDELDTLVSTWTLTQSAEEVMVLLQAAGLAAGVVQTAEDLLERDPQVKHRGYFPRLEHPVMGWCAHYDWPVKFSRTPAVICPPPIFGEYTEHVCTRILGMSQAEFLKLKAEGAFQ